jgi:hypothetical protein
MFGLRYLALNLRSILCRIKRTPKNRTAPRIVTLIAFTAVASALSANAGDQLSLRAPMARYEAQFSAAGSLMLSSHNPAIGQSNPDAGVGQTVPQKDTTSPAWLESASPTVSYLEKQRTIHSRLAWIAGDNATSLRKKGQVQVGYGPVYYDSYYDKPMTIFEVKGTRVEEPGCGYVKISFSF